MNTAHQRRIDLSVQPCWISHSVIEGLHFNSTLGEFVSDSAQATIFRGAEERMSGLKQIYAKFPNAEAKPKLLIFTYLI